MAYAELDNQTTRPVADQPPEQPVFSGWKIFLAVLLGLILVPLSFAARVDTQVVMEPDFGPDAFYYFTAISFAAGFHLLLLSLAIVALAHRFKRMMLNIVVLEMLIGYGLASVMFATIIQ